MNIPAPPAGPDYLAALGLQRAPFLDQIDDRFFYADPALVQRLDLLQHLIQFGDMLLGVVGPSGSGKSTLLRQLLARGGTTWRVCRLSATQIPQPANLLALLADGFGLDRNATPERLAADLLRLGESLRHNGQTAVVAIDDAQLLPDAALKTLLELGGTARDTLKLLRVVLFSEPGLERRLTQAGWHSPAQPLLHSLQLPVFDDHQSAAYLMYRLAAAGYSGESPFGLTEIRALHKAAGGLPGRLNVLANETLMEHARRTTARTPAAGAKRRAAAARPIIVGVTLLVAVGGLGWYARQTDEARPPATATTVDPQVPTERPPMPPADTAQPPEQRPSTTSPAAPAPTVAADPTARASAPADQPGAATGTSPSGSVSAEHDEPAPANGAGNGPQTAVDAPADPTAAGSQTPAAQTGPRSAAAPDTAPGPTPPPAAPPGPPAQDMPAGPTASATTQGTPPPAAAGDDPAGAAPAPPPATEDRAQSAPPSASAESTQPATAPDNRTEPTPTTPPAAAPSPERSAPAAAQKSPPVQPAHLPTDVLDGDWLLARPPSHFTLQLIGVRSPDSLRGYLRDHAIPAPVAYFRTRLKGSDWYVLVQGDYPSMDSARAAAAALPAAVRKDKPWPRRFTNIHADIRKADR